MDGNGRWAQQRGLPRTEGHRAGEEALFDTVEGALDLGLDWLTVYAFSTENWRRPPQEVRFLLNVISDTVLVRRRQELHERGVRVRFVGRRDWRGPKAALTGPERTRALTARAARTGCSTGFRCGGRAGSAAGRRGA